MQSIYTIRTGVLALTALTSLSLAPHCAATVINFDNLSSPTAVTNQYASQGVMFSGIEATAQFVTSVVAVTAPNYATPFYFDSSPGTLWFVDPNNASVPAYTDSVTITLDGYNNVGGWFSGATIQALDLSNSPIAGQTQTINPTNGTNYGTMSISFSGQVHALQFTIIPNPNGPGIFPFDDVTFRTLTSAPEPSTWFLVSSTLLAGLILARRRRPV